MNILFINGLDVMRFPLDMNYHKTKMFMFLVLFVSH